MRLLLHDFIGKKEAVVISLFICVAWTPSIYSSGDDFVLLGELLLPLFFLLIPFVCKVPLPRSMLVFLLPFFSYLFRVFVLSLKYGRVDLFEILLSVKQLEYFIVLVVGFLVGSFVGNPNRTSWISLGFSLSYMIFVFSDAVAKFSSFRRAGIPIKPGVATFISGFFAVLPIYFVIVYLGKDMKTLLGIVVTVFSLVTALMTFSRSNLFGLILTCLLSGVVLFITNRKKSRLVLLVFPFLLIGLSSLILSIFPWRYKGLSSIGFGEMIALLEGDSSWIARQNVVESGFHSIERNSGFLEILFGSYSLQTKRMWDNQYAKLVFEVGIVGTILYLLPFFSLLKTVLDDNSESRNFGISIMLILIHLMIIAFSGEVLTNTYVIMTPVYALFGLYLGVHKKVVHGESL